MGVDASFWNARSVLVTGASGLLGGWVCRALAEAGAGVQGLDLDWSRAAAIGGVDGMMRVDGDVRDAGVVERLLDEHSIDTVIHLAARTLVGPANADPAETFDHNVRGTWTLLDAVRGRKGVESVVVASSDKAYGDHGGAPYVEDMALRAEHPYAASKACTDLVARTYAKSFGLPVTITRCGNIYGGGDLEWSRIVPGTIHSVLRGERPVIRSDGSYVREYFYVEDAADGVAVLAQKTVEDPTLAGEAFNFGSGTARTAFDLVGEILELMGSDLQPEIRNESVNEIREQRVDARKARERLGWTATHTLRDGLALTISWYRSFLAAAA